MGKTTTSAMTEFKLPGVFGRFDAALLPAFGGLLILTLLMFGDVLFASGSIVLSEPGRDLSTLFIPWKEFAIREIKSGHFPLWNPHIVGGYPFFGSFQPALLYPLNWFYLVLPLHRALNCDIALHIFLLGWFLFLWTRWRGLHPVAGFCAAAVLMFCAPVFLRIFPGHITPLAVMAWAPLVLLSCDALLQKPSSGWWLLGVFAITMQIVAGYPQYMFYTALAVFIYGALFLSQSEAPIRERIKAFLPLPAMYCGAAAIGAVQILTGLQASGESVRGGGAPYGFASEFSFPPESFITFLVPGFFGDRTAFPYWGRWLMWEMSGFVGVAGLALALFGALHADKRTRRILLASVLVFCVLAMGEYTPLFRLLFNFVPGFSSFRANAKFLFIVALFLALLTAIGMDGLIRSARYSRHAAITAAILAAIVTVAGVATQAFAAQGVNGTFAQIPAFIAATRDTTYAPGDASNPLFIADAGAFATKQLFICSAWLLVVAALFGLRQRHPKAAYLLALAAVCEVFNFARAHRPTFDMNAARQPEIERFFAEHRGDERFLKPGSTNEAMSWNAFNLAGYDPFVSLRYAEFIAWTQGRDPDKRNPFLKFERVHPLYAMLRCRYAFVKRDGKTVVIPIKNVMPRLQLVQDYTILNGRNRIFSAMGTDFDPRREVILESAPDPAPAKAAIPQNPAGTATLLNSSSGALEIRANLAQPALLLITDSYSSGWRAVALSDSAQQQYQLLPANYILRAVPLAAGKHHFRVEYMPRAFQIGLWISLFSLAFYFALIVRQIRRSHFSTTTHPDFLEVQSEDRPLEAHAS